MADTTSSSLFIAAPADAILQVIADLPAYPEWNGEITSVEVLDSARDGRPRQARFALSSTGMSDEYVLDYDWSAAGVSWQLAAPSTLMKSQVGSYRLVPEGEGTAVHYELTINARIPMIGAMRRKIEKRIVDGALKELKKRVEAGS